jgi:tRNA A-37 threonylcarbamoyl transferase component Bud32
MACRADGGGEAASCAEVDQGGLYASAVIQRFESARQSLAVYVDGPPITRYCDNKKLKIQERLELFIKVCERVQRAHQKAIIHRDLKPSNVSVVEANPISRSETPG